MICRWNHIAILMCALSFAGVAFADRRCPMGVEGAAMGLRAAVSKRLLLRDTDRDGVPDCVELALGSDPRRPQRASAARDLSGLVDLVEQYAAGKLDSDGDGISDRDERRSVGTNPYLSDTDRDGILDGDEIGVIPVSLYPETVNVRPLATAKKCKKTQTTQRLARRGGAFTTLAVKKKCKKKKKTPTPSPSASPSGSSTPRPSPTRTPGSGGDAARGQSLYSANCLSCHGVHGGKTASQISAAMSSISEHAPVRSMMTGQNLLDVAAYLATR